MNNKQKTYLALIILVLAITFFFRGSLLNITGSNCNLGDWSAPSYNPSTGEMVIKMPSGNIPTYGGCYGTSTVSAVDLGGLKIYDKETCDSLSQRWDVDEKVCVYASDSWFKGKEITYPGTCTVHYQNGQTAKIDLGNYITFDGSKINVPNRGQLYGSYPQAYVQCAGEIVINSEKTCPSLNELNCNPGYTEKISTDAEGCEINYCIKEENQSPQQQDNQSGEAKQMVTSSILSIIGVILLFIFLFWAYKKTRR